MGQGHLAALHRSEDTLLSQNITFCACPLVHNCHPCCQWGFWAHGKHPHSLTIRWSTADTPQASTCSTHKHVVRLVVVLHAATSLAGLLHAVPLLLGQGSVLTV